jgi:hypothetical protein
VASIAKCVTRCVIADGILIASITKRGIVARKSNGITFTVITKTIGAAFIIETIINTHVIKSIILKPIAEYIQVTNIAKNIITASCTKNILIAIVFKGI